MIVDNQYLLPGDFLFVKSKGCPDLAGKASDWVADLRTRGTSDNKKLSENLIGAHHIQRKIKRQQFRRNLPIRFGLS
ncbi:hypothetical protein ACFQI7_14330 [Paenibacillus allorhizosphaerae]|uniref:hypothetical protein n=1 Tax=Paenibacillus allorhizosphaerae TaxID=2849866 RepID=UPI001C4069B2|nr:hypothetical protein [Paenibacillus allorhizosphaerae]